MLYLFIAIAFASIFAQFYKLSNKHRFDGLSVTLGAYLSAVTILSLYLQIAGEYRFEAQLVKIGLFGGISTFIAVLSFYYVVKFGRLGMSWAVISLSFLLPVIISAVWWYEQVSPRKASGLVLGVVAIIFLGKELSAKGKQQCGTG